MSGSSSFDLDEIRIAPNGGPAQSGKRRPRSGFYQPRSGEKFLKGPVPLFWVMVASKLPGKALHVGIALWYLAGLTKSPVLKLNQSRLKDFGITRDSARRGLRALEHLGLILVVRKTGRKPQVTILFDSGSKSGGAQ